MIRLEDTPEILYRAFEDMSFFAEKPRQIRREAEIAAQKALEKIEKAAFDLSSIRVFLRGYFFESQGVSYVFAKKFLQITEKPFPEQICFFRDLFQLMQEKEIDKDAVTFFLLLFLMPKEAPFGESLSPIGLSFLEKIEKDDEPLSFLKEIFIFLQTKGVYLSEEDKIPLFVDPGDYEKATEPVSYLAPSLHPLILQLNREIEEDKKRLNSVFKEEIIERLEKNKDFLIEERERLLSEIEEKAWYFLPQTGVVCFPPSLAKSLNFKKFLLSESEEQYLFKTSFWLLNQRYDVLVNKEGKIESNPWWICLPVSLYLETLLCSFYHDLVIKIEVWQPRERKVGEIKELGEVTKKEVPRKTYLPHKVYPKREGEFVPEKQISLVKRPYFFSRDRFFRRLPEGQHPLSSQIKKAKEMFNIELDSNGNITLVIPQKLKGLPVSVLSTSAGQLDQLLGPEI